MKSSGLLRCVATLALAFTCPAQADCAFPKAPASVPDGKTASEQKMVAGQDARMQRSAWTRVPTLFRNSRPAEKGVRS